MLVKVINGLIALLALIVNGTFGLLPDTPFEFTPVSWGVFGNLVGYIIPVGSMATHMLLILGAFMTYYGLRWLLRVIRMVR